MTGTIKGRVVTEDGQPLANANVIFALLNQSSQRAVISDAEGKFEVTEIPAGIYTTRVLLAGYVVADDSVYSQAPHYVLGDFIKIVMRKGGVITGKVTNDVGDPVVAVPVRAVRVSEMTGDSLQSLAYPTSRQTDDRGVFRIYGLPPGNYAVAAGGSNIFGASIGAYAGDSPTYYPSTTRDAAIIVAVRSGDETTGIDIRYRGDIGHAVSGTITGVPDTGQPNLTIITTLSHVTSGAFEGFSFIGGGSTNRGFEFSAIADGEYVVAAGLLSQTDNSLFGYRRVTVRGGDVTGVELKLTAFSSISGTVSLAPIADEAKCDKRGSQIREVLVQPQTVGKPFEGKKYMTFLTGNPGGQTNDKGEFSVRNLFPGRYLLSVELPGDVWYVRQLTIPPKATPTPSPPAKPAQPANLSGMSLELKAGDKLNGIAITIGQDGAVLRGQVTAAKEGESIPSPLRVHLLPAEREQSDNALRFYETIVDSSGVFAFKNLAPGKYFMVTRVIAADESLPSQPVASDPAARATLRKEAEAANNSIELKPCQRVSDFVLKLKATP
jgi:hypothetical protein